MAQVPEAEGEERDGEEPVDGDHRMDEGVEAIRARERVDVRAETQQDQDGDPDHQARRAMLAGLAVIALASLIGAAATDTAMLLATRFFEGLGFIVAVIAAPALIARAAAPSDQRLALGVWSCYVPTGSALMMVLSPPLIAGVGWRGLWLFNTVVVALVAIAVGWATRRMPPAQRSDGRGLGAIAADILRTLRHPGPPALALAFGCYALQYLSVVGFLPTLLMQSDGMSAATAGTLAALAGALNAVGTVSGGWLLHRGVPRWLLIAVPSLVMAASSMVIYAAPLPFALRYGAVLVFAGMSGTMPAALFSAAPRHAASLGLVGTTVGLINQGSNLGQTIGPPTLAAIAAATGSWAWSPAVLSAAAMVGLAMGLVIRRLERRGA